MERKHIPRSGEIYRHFKDKLYQIITVALDSETGEKMVVYQALYGDFKTYVRSLAMFLSEVDHEKYPEVNQTYRFELRELEESEEDQTKKVADALKEVNEPYETEKFYKTDGLRKADTVGETEVVQEPNLGVNEILLQFLDASSYNKKLEVISSNLKHMNDRLINDMAVSLDCSVNEGPIEQRIQGLIYCLQAMCRFEDRRLR